MDLIIVGDLIQKISSIFLFKETKNIQVFIDDPLMLELNHLDYINSVTNKSRMRYFQFGGVLSEPPISVSDTPQPNNSSAFTLPIATGPGGEKMADILNNIQQTMGKEVDEENPIYKLMTMITKIFFYPLLLLFLIIYPYIYVTMKSFKNIYKLYKKNVLTI